MKIFSCEQVKNIDQYTILHEPIASVELMERAAGQLFKWVTYRFGRTDRIIIFAGPGNNGGDGIALARMLALDRYDVKVHYVKFTDRTSADWEENLKRLETETDVKLSYLISADQFPVISSEDVIIDAIMGSGLTRPLEGLPREVINHINKSNAKVISIDIPSGLFGEDNSKNIDNPAIKADFTLSFQFPKLSFMFAENDCYVGEWVVLPIGLNSNAINNTISSYEYIGKSDVLPLLRVRNKFEHKGNFGHALLIAGSSGKMGAAVLCAGAALRSGIGLITCHIPKHGDTILQTALPEAMVRMDKSDSYITDTGDSGSFTAVGLGPGIGTLKETEQAVHRLLTECNKPMVIDADALNILASNSEWLSLMSAETILTPHPKEFERLAGAAESGFSRLEMQISFSKKYNCIVVLKGAHTSVTTPMGKVMFNSSGNPGMATAGSGDVLTGIILSLLAQGYSPENAALVGVYLHGLAGDLAEGASCYEAIIASDIIKSIGRAFNDIRNFKP